MPYSNPYTHTVSLTHPALNTHGGVRCLPRHADHKEYTLTEHSHKLCVCVCVDVLWMFVNMVCPCAYRDMFVCVHCQSVHLCGNCVCVCV